MQFYFDRSVTLPDSRRDPNPIFSTIFTVFPYSNLRLFEFARSTIVFFTFARDIPVISRRKL
jgi:hypothetical protein